jgi:hypothetical protein
VTAPAGRRGRLGARDTAGPATVETRVRADRGFETRVSGGLIEGGFQRYATEREALGGHDGWVRLVAGAERIAADAADPARAVRPPREPSAEGKPG